MASNFTPDDNELELLQAIAAALSACNEAGQPGEPVIGRITLGPVDLHGSPEAYRYCHSADLTAAGLVEALKMLGAMPPAPAVVGSADKKNSPDDQVYFASKHKGLAAELTDVFNSIDPLDVQSYVLDHRSADLPDVIQAVDEVLGKRYDALADEDDN